ncbi:MAG: DUF1015 domain-containing protein [Thermoanaerobaculia bacterium]|nr:DUF1015 domain-containing protein [Thermoanaerobaculia bacterium]
MQIFAFQGFRYSSRVGRPGDMAAPPFDQIDDRLRDELHARSPYHFSRFTRSLPRGLDDEHEAAAVTHAQWIEDGAVVRDRFPSLYPYVIEAPGEDPRPALCCCLDVGSPEQSALRPHERTVEKPLENRLALLRETRIDPEPVMLLADDDGALESLLAQDLEGAESLVSHTDGGGAVHRLYSIAAPERIETYKEVLAGRSATIADGHHRVRTAQLYAREIGARAGMAAATKMAVLISVRSRGLRIDPIHRQLAEPLQNLGLQRGVVSRQPLSVANGRELAAKVAGAEPPSLAVWVHGGDPELWRLDPEQAPADTPTRGRALTVVLLHHMLLPAVGVELDASVDGTIAYRSDPETLFSAVDRGEAGTGIWLPPMDAQEFATAVSGGDLLPPKSTRFLPKLVSGLVWTGHDSELL